MSHIIAISGSLRRASFNTALVRAAQRQFPDQVRAGSIQGIPLYNADVEEADGIPEAVTSLQQQIIAAAGVLLVTPEYNNSLPGVFKNAVDWLSRPPQETKRIFHGKPVAVLGASPGGFGTILAQNAWLPVLRTLKMRVWSGGRLMVSRVSDKLDEEGELADEKTRAALQEFVQGFVEFCRH